MGKLKLIKTACCVVVLLTLSCNREDSNNQEGCKKWWLNPNTLPAWAQVGKVHCSRWDGGPIEAKKGQLSGWTYWEEGDPEGVLKAVENFYDVKTIEWAKRAGLNWLWVTWSNGFSHETESRQWEILRPYIKKCHENGIHVSAYMSGANMFKEDMLRHVPRSKEWWKLDSNGKPVPYGNLGATRYMANTQHPDWLPYQRVRIRKALEAGIDGFWIDNIGTKAWETSIKQLVDVMMEEGKKLGVTPVVNFNFHRGSFILGRYMNSISSEDGLTPGIYRAAEESGTSLITAMEEQPDIPLTEVLEMDYGSVDKPNTLICNTGLLKYLYAVSEGWRPVGVENGNRDKKSSRLTDYMTPELWQLSLAECQMYSISQEPFVEGIFARDLFAGETKAFECLDAMGAYNRFFEEKQEYYLNPESIAGIAVAGQTEGDIKKERWLITYLNKLSACDVQYDVLLDVDFQKANLARYKVLVLMSWIELNEVQSACLKQWVLNGGKLLVFGNKGQRIKMLQTVLEEGRQSLGKGEIYFSEDNPFPQELSEKLTSLTKEEEPVQIEAPWYVLHRTVKQTDKSRLIVHLLNYSQEAANGIELISKAVSPDSVLVLSPDSEKSWRIKGTPAPNGKIRYKIPVVETYCVVMFSGTIGEIDKQSP